MYIWIVGDGFGFPNGYGASARVYAYAKGLKENGVNVRVICLKAFECPESGILNTELSGIYDGIPFEYTCGAIVRGERWLQRRWLELRGIWGLVRAARTHRRQAGKLDAVHIYSAYSLLWICVAWAVAKSVGAKTLFEVCEFPYVYRIPTVSTRIQKWILTRVVFCLLNGFVVISRFLEEYVLHVYPKARVLRVPILVDVTCWTGISQVSYQNTKKNVVYVGNLSHKSEISDLISAFATVASDYRDAYLQIIGDSGAAIRNQLQAEIQAQDLTDRVQLIGAVKRGDLPCHLSSADILVLPRSDRRFSQAGFPTKLGEYLATGKPVVVTTTGEIADHLQDRVNAFLVPPDSVDAFAAALRYVLSHPGQAADVGKRGKEIAERKFDYRLHGKRLIEFITRI